MRPPVLALVATCMVAMSFTPPLASQTAPRANGGTLREYLVDYGESIVEFSVGFAFSRVKGRFTNGKGTILYDEARPANSSVSMILETKSLDTGWPHRDEHLQTGDFFEVAKFPTITFQSERIVPNGDGWIANGKLTMHGVTKDIAIPFKLLRPPTRNAEARWMVMNLTGGLKLARADFGIFGGSKYNSWFNKARQASVADSVDVSLEIEAYSADATTFRSAGVEDALKRIGEKGVPSQVDWFLEQKKARSPAEFAQYQHAADVVMRGLIATGKAADAATLGRTMAEMFSNATRVAAVYGMALSISGDSKGAAREYVRMKQIFKPPVVDPNEKFPQVDENWYWLDQLAQNAVEWGYPALALPLARTVAELYPGTARAHTTLGTILAANGDVKGAATAYAKALEVDPRETRALEWRRRLP